VARRTDVDTSVVRFQEWMAVPNSPVRAIRHIPARAAEFLDMPNAVQPALKKAKLEVMVEACGKRLCRREIIELRASRKKPHRRTQQLLESILKRLGFL